VCAVIIASGSAAAASIPGTDFLCPLMPALCAPQSGLNPVGSTYTELILLLFDVHVPVHR
jgi:hypothetical protein